MKLILNRYTCGHCGRQTNIYESMIEMESTITKRGSNNNNFTVDEVIHAITERCGKVLKIIKEEDIIYGRTYSVYNMRSVSA